MCHTGVLSCTGKLARVVLDNQGPLSPTEIAEEAHISGPEARKAIEELQEEDLVESVCGLCDSQEEVYELTEKGHAFDANPA